MKLFISLLIVMLTEIVPAAYCQPSTEEIVSRMVKQVQKNVEAGDDYGFRQEVLVKKLKDGKVDEQERRTYRTTWIEGKSYSELLKINDQKLSSSQKSEELRRKQEFLKSVRGQGKQDGIVAELKSIRWWEIVDKYDFQSVSPDNKAAYLLLFRPKSDDLPERNRVDKILNHLSGKIWLDEDCNVMRALTELSDPIRFAWGIAKLDEMKAQFEQQEIGGAFFPASLHVAFKAHATFLKKEHQEITAQWSEVFPKPFGEGAGANTLVSRKR